MATLLSIGGSNAPGGGGAGVSSFNTRVGDVVPNNTDYDTSLVDPTTNRNYATDAEKTKLANTSGTNTGDETPATVKSKYESNADTNAYTDAEKTKLAGLEGSNFLGEYVSLAALQAAHPTADPGNYAYVDGGVGQPVEKYIWDSSDMQWALQLGESTAETPASIKSKYESNPDTNAFTDAEKTNLSNQSNTNTGDETQTSIQTKRPLGLINSMSIENGNDVNVNEFDPDADNVLIGYESAQDATQSTTSSTVGIPYINLAYTGVIGETYILKMSCSISHDATNSNGFIDILDFGASILVQNYTVEPKDTSNRWWINIEAEVQPNALGGGAFALQLNFGTDDGTDTTTMYFAKLSLQKKPN